MWCILTHCIHKFCSSSRSGVWSYVINAVTTPIFMAVPIITIWVGVFPVGRPASPFTDAAIATVEQQLSKIR